METGECSCEKPKQNLLLCIHGVLVHRLLSTPSKTATDSHSIGVTSTELCSDKFYGAIYKTANWRQTFSGYSIFFPSNDQVDSFKLQFGQKLKYPKVLCPFTYTTQVVSSLRITSTGEKPSGKTISASKICGKSRINCKLCGKLLSKKTTHTSSACEKYRTKNPAYFNQVMSSDFLDLIG